MGGLTFFVFLALAVTGVLLMFYYRPTAEYAFNDVIAMRQHVPLGITPCLIVHNISPAKIKSSMTASVRDKLKSNNNPA